MPGIGCSTKRDSLRAGQEAARQAAAALGPGQTTAWALAFSGGDHDPDSILRGIRDEVGAIPIYGGSSLGSITNHTLGYSGVECAVAVFSEPAPTACIDTDLAHGERETGDRLGAELARYTRDGDTVLLLYDSVRSVTPFRLHVGSRLVEGLYHGLVQRRIHLIGAGTVADKQITSSFVFDGKQAAKHTACAIVLPRRWTPHTAIMHGCVPVSEPVEITRMDGPVVYELDGRPALDVIREVFQDAPVGNRPALTVTLGEKHGDPDEPYNESHYINRLILGSNPVDGSVTLFEDDFCVGAKVQIMARDNKRMLESVVRRTRELLASIGSNTPAWAFYIDCGGRARFFSGADEEEAAVLQKTLPATLPLLGFYSGVEIAPLLERSRPLDWTGVLTVFSLTPHSNA